MKLLRKIFLYLSLTIAIVVIALVTSLFLFKDRIIQQFIREANKQLNTPVRVGKIEATIMESFPNISIVLNDVYVEDSHPGESPLLTARRVAFQLDPLSVWGGDYTIVGLSVTDSETNLKINNAGNTNYAVVKPSGTAAQAAVTFELKDVVLSNTIVRYKDIRNEQDLSFSSTRLVASIRSERDVYSIAAEGHLQTDKINVDGKGYLTGKSFEISSTLTYDDVSKIVTIQPSDLQLPRASFLVHGTYGWKDKSLIDIQVDGKESDIQTLLSLLPAETAEKLSRYKSKGDVYFRSRLKGEISRTRLPSLSIDFGFEDATIFHPDYRATVEHANLRGSFATSDLRNPRAGSLILKQIQGTLNGKEFAAEFILQNFVDPQIITKFKGHIDASSVLDFYPVEGITDVSGSLHADIALEGRLAVLKSKATAQQISTHGSIELQHINLNVGKGKVPVRDLSGYLQFNNNDLALSNVSGGFGKSDFLLNGFFKNIVTFVMFENQPIGIETDLKSAHIDADELFAIGFGTDTAVAGTETKYHFSISPNVHLNFNCDIGSLKYRRFSARGIRGDLLVKSEVAVSRTLSFASMGGNITLSGILDAKNHKAIDVVSTLKLDRVNVDSVFYVFENFKQTFIEDRHLKGRATAEVNLDFTLNEELRLFPETLVADIGFSISNGQLNNFEPLRSLNKYLDDEGLNRLRFSELKNDIHIEKKTVYIPQTEVRSNVTHLRLSGTHTFDQQIDYRIVTPLRQRRVIDVDARQAVEEEQGQAKLFLKIVGTTDDYRVLYDTEAVKKKIAGDFKREVQELRDAFRTKGKKKEKEKEIELRKDDYFDWTDQ